MFIIIIITSQRSITKEAGVRRKNNKIQTKYE
jgi:hypothetical protein